MIKVIAGIVATVAFGMLIFTAVGLANKPPAPPGQDPCSHGRTGKPCRPDPQPAHGKDCEHHGNKGGVNEDHCKGTTTGTTETTTTQSTTTKTTTTSTTTSTGTTTSSQPTEKPPVKHKPKPRKPIVIPGTKLHKCPTGTHKISGKVGCFRNFHGKPHPVFLGNG